MVNSDYESNKKILGNCWQEDKRQEEGNLIDLLHQLFAVVWREEFCSTTVEGRPYSLMRGIKRIQVNCRFLV